MMDDLQAIAKLIEISPEILPAVAMLLLYKAVVVMAICVAVCFVAAKIHSAVVTKNAREVEYKEIRPMLDGICVKASVDQLIAQLHRIKNTGSGKSFESNYVHTKDVDWLREAIDEKTARDVAKKLTS